eukprot:1945710-Lingulodinium_polyedra.AAC.1
MARPPMGFDERTGKRRPKCRLRQLHCNAERRPSRGGTDDGTTQIAEPMPRANTPQKCTRKTVALRAQHDI